MTVNDRTDHVLVQTAEFQPGDIGRLNQLLDRVGLKSRLGDPPDGPPGEHATLISVPVHGDQDEAGPSNIEAAVRSAQADGQSVPSVLAGTHSIAGTLVRGAFF
jgi:hypothetical protein